jgi:hypothetical protein
VSDRQTQHRRPELREPVLVTSRTSKTKKPLARPQRIALVVATVLVATAIVLMTSPVGSAPVDNTPESSMHFCGRVINPKHDVGHCGTRLATRQTLATVVLVSGIVFGVGSIWAWRPEQPD